MLPPRSPVEAPLGRPALWRVWWLAIRPRTLTVTLSPLLVGAALAGPGAFLPGVFVLTLLAALAIQIGTNLHNDAADFERGTDTGARVGPLRVSAMGWLSPQAVHRGAWLAFALAFVAGIGLVVRGGWPIVAVGLSALVAGWGYTGGRHPIAHSPLGEFFVVLFFGVAAVAGTFYLQTLTISPAAVLAGLILGAFGAAVITVNNHRDRVGDAQSGRRTLAILLGRRATVALYVLELLLPYALLPVLAVLLGRGSELLLPLLTLPVAFYLLRCFASEAGSRLNAVLGATALLQAGFSLLLALTLFS